MKTLYDILIERVNLKDYQINELNHYKDILQNVDIEVLNIAVSSINAQQYLKSLLNPELIQIEEGPALSLIKKDFEEFLTDIKNTEHPLASMAGADAPPHSIFVFHNKNKDLRSLFVVQHFVNGFYFQNNYNKAFFNTHLFMERLMPVCCEQYLLNHKIEFTIQTGFTPFEHSNTYPHFGNLEKLNQEINHCATKVLLQTLNQYDYSYITSLPSVIKCIENYCDSELARPEKFNSSHLRWTFKSFDEEAVSQKYKSIVERYQEKIGSTTAFNKLDKFIRNYEEKTSFVQKFLSTVALACLSPAIIAVILAEKYHSNKISRIIENDLTQQFKLLLPQPQDMLFMPLIKYFSLFNLDRQKRLSQFVNTVEDTAIAKELKILLRPEDKVIIEKHTLGQKIERVNTSPKKKNTHKL